MSAGLKEGGTWCSGSLHLVALFSSLMWIKQVSTRRKWLCLILSSLKQEMPATPLQQTLTMCKTMTPPVSLFSVRFPPSPCIQTVCLPNSTPLLCFISCVAVFENPTLQRAPQYGPTLIPWERVLLCCGQCQLVPEESGRTARQFTVYDKSQHTAYTRDCCPQPAAFFLYW